MADTKLSAEAAAAALGGTELVDGVQSGGNVKITINQIKTYILATAALLVANTFTATQTITPAADTAALVISGGSITGSGAASFLSIAGTWNTSGSPVALNIDITNTTSSGSASFIRGKINTTTVFEVNRSGVIIGSGLSNAANGAVAITHANGDDVRVSNTSGDPQLGFYNATTYRTGFVSTGTAVLNIGRPNAASPVAQTLGVQGSRSGTDTNVAGANFTVCSGIGTGNATGSSLIFQTPTPVASGTGAQTAATRLTLSALSGVVVASGVALQLGNAAVTGLGAGVLAALTNASIVITDGGGQAYRIPCLI